MNNSLLGVIVLGSALLLSAPAPAFGQAVYGSIAGNVVDSNGATVPRPKVTIIDTGKGGNYVTSTNDSGNYSQTHLLVGLYDVRVQAPGFTNYVHRTVTV